MSWETFVQSSSGPDTLPGPASWFGVSSGNRSLAVSPGLGAPSPPPTPPPCDAAGWRVLPHAGSGWFAPPHSPVPAAARGPALSPSPPPCAGCARARPPAVLRLVLRRRGPNRPASRGAPPRDTCAARPRPCTRLPGRTQPCGLTPLRVLGEHGEELLSAGAGEVAASRGTGHRPPDRDTA